VFVVRFQCVAPDCAVIVFVVRFGIMDLRETIHVRLLHAEAFDRKKPRVNDKQTQQERQGVAVPQKTP